MPPGITLQSDFTAGELSPSLLARVDLAKYNKGCRTMRNFLVQSHGPAVKRPGFILIGDLPGPAALMEFVFNNDQAYALIFGERWMRVASHEGFVLGSDGKPYQIASPYTLAQARELSFVQSADVVFLAHQKVAPQRLARLGHANWQFSPLSFSEPVAPPTGLAVTFVNGATNSDGTSSPAKLVTPYTYYVTSVDANGRTSGASTGADIAGPSSNNWQSGDYIEFTWSAVDGAEEYRVYKGEFGGSGGYITTVGNTSYRDYNVAPSVSEGMPKYTDPFVIGQTTDYPGAVCLFEQRLVFASSPNRPQTIWMSKSGDYTNFAAYTPIADDSPIELTIASQEVTPANWMVPLRSLIFGTSGMEWEIAGSGGNAFTAKNAKATPQSYWGSSLRRAMVVGNVILHVSSSGSQVRNLQYDFGSDSYGGLDLSILSSHLFEEYKLIDWAYQKNPDSIIWGVRSDGVLIGLTFQAEHQVSAWHRHDTQGKFTACCAVPNGYEHTLFAVTLRDGLYYLERMAERYRSGDPSRAVFLDAALTYDGNTAVQTLSGLEHLEGKEVGIFSDGAVEASRKVVGGRITLDQPAKIVTVGLPYAADLETMPVEVIGNSGASVGLKKQISTINISFHESSCVKAGLSTSSGNLDDVKWQEIKWRANEPYGTPPAPFTGVKHLTMPNMAENILSVCIRSDLPTPVTVQSIMSRMEVKS